MTLTFDQYKREISLAIRRDEPEKVVKLLNMAAGKTHSEVGRVTIQEYDGLVYDEAHEFLLKKHNEMLHTYPMPPTLLVARVNEGSRQSSQATIRNLDGILKNIPRSEG